MKVFKFIPPYKGNGRTNFPNSKKRAGVYIIKENGKIVYIGHSQSNLYKTLYRHFQTWNHKYQEVISYQSRLSRNNYTVRIIYTTPAQAVRLERYLVMKYQPRDNTVKYEGYQLNAFDQNTYKTYQQTEVETEAPF